MAQPPSYGGGRPPDPGRIAQPGPNALSLVAEGAAALGQAFLRADLQRRDNDLRLQNAADRAREIEDQNYVRTAGAKHSADLATRQGALLQRVAELRSTAAPGAEGHEASIAAEVETFRTGFMDGLDERLQPLFMDNVAEIAASVGTSEARWSIEQRAARAVTDSTQLANTLGNTLFTAVNNGTATGEQLRTATNQWDEAIARAPLPGNARAELRRQGHQVIQSGAMRALIQTRPGEAVTAIDGGWGADLFEQDDLARFRASAAAGVERLEAQARAAAREAAEASRAQADVLAGQVTDGVVLPADGVAALEAELARTEGSTEPADIRQRDAIRETLARNAVNARYDTATQDERRAAQAAIEAQQGWRNNPELVRAHDQIGRLIGRDQTAASDDMLSLQSRQSGRAIPPLDLGNLAGMDARFALGDQAARRYRRDPQYLTREEAGQLREQWNRAPPAERAATIQNFARFGFRRGGLLMRQVLPSGQEGADSAALLRIATMRDRAAGANHIREALDGWASPAAAALAPQARMEAAVRQRFGPALAGLGGDVRAGHMNVARGIYSHRAAQRGIANYDEALWIESYQDAFGRAGSTGGFATLSGGRQILLPRGLNGNDIGAVVGAAMRDPSLLTGWSGGDRPMWGSRELSPVELLGLTPVLVYDDGGEAHYQFRNETGFVRSATAPGRNYVMRIRARPPR